MPKTLITKSLLSISGIVGTCCAVTIPATVNVSNPILTGGGAKPTNSLLKVGVEHSTSTKGSSFEEVGQEINKGYKAQQTQGNTFEDLPFKERLKDILEKSESSGNLKGNIHSQQWKSCLLTQVGQGIDCGYTYLNGQNGNYKLRIKYELEHKLDEGAGRVYIVRNKTTDKTSQYDFDKGKDSNNINFENLVTSFQQSDNPGGNSIDLALKQTVNVKERSNTT